MTRPTLPEEQAPDAGELARKAAAQIADEDTATQVLGIKTTLSEIRCIIESALAAAREERDYLQKLVDEKHDEFQQRGGRAEGQTQNLMGCICCLRTGRRGGTARA